MKTIMIHTLFSFLSILAISCSGGDDSDSGNTEKEEITPTDLSLDVTVVGVDTDNPNGDGSGTIECSATAINVVSYKFKFGNGEEVTNSLGNVEFTYDTPRVNEYKVTVEAYSTTNHSISSSKDITVYYNDEPQLVWSDEFDEDGAPDSSKWGYDIGTGQNGWGNGESQYYNSRPENVIVEGGLLKITAKRESYMGSEFTSTRMLTKDKYEFTEGKIEIKAKLPQGGGTWPALWMLGANIDEVGWPACGEIDIMEHVGNNQDRIQSAMHTPNTSNLGGQTVTDVSTEFHLYQLEWTAEKMVFSVDGNVHYTYQPANKNAETWPFNADQFIIMNIAMGGGLGGEIHPEFTASTMEIDYVRVYQ